MTAGYDPAFGEKVARLVTFHYWGPDQEDLKQIARIAVWENAGKDRNLVYNIAQKRVIDEHRRLHGRREPSRTAKLKFEFDPAFMDEPVWDEYDLGPTDPVADLGLADGGRHEHVARGLAAGRLKQELADDLGVTPGQVSHILSDMRRRIRGRERALR